MQNVCPNLWLSKDVYRWLPKLKILPKNLPKIESTTKLACWVFYFFGVCLCKIENLAKEILTYLTKKYSEKYNLLRNLLLL